MANNTAQHILSTSANLLGFCLFVITSLHIANRTKASRLDELTSCIAVVLTSSCIFPFFSIQTSYLNREKRLESIADLLFVFSLVGILVIILLITLNFIS